MLYIGCKFTDFFQIYQRLFQECPYRKKSRRIVESLYMQRMYFQELLTNSKQKVVLMFFTWGSYKLKVSIGSFGCG